MMDYVYFNFQKVVFGDGETEWCLFQTAKSIGYQQETVYCRLVYS
jgi:hypothetical protein